LTTPPAPPTNFTPYAIAALAAVALLAAGTIGAVLFLRQSPAPVAQDDRKSHNQEDEDRRLEEKRKKLEDENRRLEQENKKLDLKRLLTQGNEALEKHHYSEAEKAFSDALALFPTDEAALKGLIAARSGAAIESQSKGSQEQRKAEFNKYLTQGKEAVALKKYAEAVDAFQSALNLIPGDPDASKLLADAKAALALEEGTKKTEADYQAHMEAARVAMINQRYADALREYLAALRIKPKDDAALKGQKQAEAQLGAMQNKDQRTTAFNNLMDRGRTALAARRFDEAIDQFKAALNLMPNDPDAQRELSRAQQARTSARADFNQAMTQANLALQNNQLELAVKLFGDALRIFPDDPEALRGQQVALSQIGNLQAAQAAYIRYLNQGTLAMQSSRYADAVANFLEALNLVPNDPQATRLLRDARIALDKETRARLEFDKAYKAGVAALNQRRWADALQFLGDAQKMQPDNQQVATALSQARYGKAMADGQAAMSARRWTEAIQDFQNALKEKPGDPQATNFLNNAKRMNTSKGSFPLAG
jgi:tetratricopeptide (TPR) repeat protein